MTNESAVRSALALMIAPRRLQSLAAPVQADAPALSSVRSTFSVVVTGMKKLTRSRAARDAGFNSVTGLDAALCVNLSDATHKNAMPIRKRLALIFIGSAPGFRVYLKSGKKRGNGWSSIFCFRDYYTFSLKAAREIIVTNWLRQIGRASCR